MTLYRCADQIHLPVDLYDTIDASQITPLEIIRHDVVSPGSKEVALQEKDVVVEWLTLNFALKDRNPMDSVRFYSKYDTKKSIAIPKEHISSFIPNHFKEVIIKVFVRDASKAGRVQDAFRRFLKSINEQLVQQQQENVWDEEDEADEADEATQTDAEIQPAPVQVPQQMTVPAQSPAKNPPLDACFFSPRQKSPRVIGSPSVPVSKSTPIVDRSHLNPFFVEKGPSPGVAGLTSKSACSSRTGSPSKSILEPSDALTLPKNFHKIMADSPARKRKR